MLGQYLGLRYIAQNYSIKQALSLQQGRRQDDYPSMLFRTFAVHIALGVMRVTAYKSVDPVNFNIGRDELIGLLGASEGEEESRTWAIELRYLAGVYRFDSDSRLKEVSVDAPGLEVHGGNVSFESLHAFLEQNDSDILERVSFLVSPRFGLAFDQDHPSWVTTFPSEELSRWRTIENKK